MFIKGYATALELTQTLKALPLARRFHNGQHRKGEVVNYPELSNGFTILKSKIVSLTELTETVVDIKDREIESLKEKIKELKSQLSNAK